MPMFHGHSLSANRTELLAGVLGKDTAQGVLLSPKDKENRMSNVQRKVFSLQVDLPSAKPESRRQEKTSTKVVKMGDIYNSVNHL